MNKYTGGNIWLLTGFYFTTVLTRTLLSQSHRFHYMPLRKSGISAQLLRFSHLNKHVSVGRNLRTPNFGIANPINHCLSIFKSAVLHIKCPGFKQVLFKHHRYRNNVLSLSRLQGFTTDRSS
jgi:hypothetical protein